MPQITRSLEEIAASVETLRKDASKASREAKVLQEQLKIKGDTTKRVETLNKLQANLNLQLQNQKTRLEQVNTLVDQYNKLVDAGQGDVEKYAIELAKWERTQSSLELQIQKTNNQLAKTQESIEDIDLAKWEKFKNITDATQKKLTLLATQMFALTKTQITDIKEMDVLAKRYDTTISNVAKNQYILEVATGNARAYEEALKGVTTGLSDIAEGRGIAYLNALKQLGISKEQITSVEDMSQAYELIIGKLRGVEGTATKAALATALFGQEAGLSVLEILKLTDKEISQYEKDAEGYTQALQRYSERLVEMDYKQKQAAISLDELKLLLAVGFLPVLEAGIDIFETVMGIVDSLPDGVKEVMSKFTAWAIIILLVSTTITKMTTAAKLAKGAIDALGISASTTAGKLGKLLTIASLVAALIGSIVGSINEVEEDIDKAQKDYEDMLNDLNNDVNTSADINATSYKTRTFNMQVDIYGHGDTTVSDETGEKIAQLTAEEINEQLGKELSTK